MANEAVKVQGTGVTSNMRTYTIADSPAVTKHTLLFLSGDNTASFSTTETPAADMSKVYLGVNTAAKEAADGATTINVDAGGVWDMVASNAIVGGSKVILGEGNKVVSADDGTAALTASGGLVVGVAMETATAGETIRVDTDRK